MPAYTWMLPTYSTSAGPPRGGTASARRLPSPRVRGLDGGRRLGVSPEVDPRARGGAFRRGPDNVWSEGASPLLRGPL